MRTIIQIIAGTMIKMDRVPEMMVKTAETSRWTKNTEEKSLLEYAKMVVETREEAKRLIAIADNLQNFVDDYIILEQSKDESKDEEKS